MMPLGSYRGAGGTGS